MTTQNEYRQYAQECARSAVEAETNEDRQLFLQMAKAWINISLVESDVAKQSKFQARRHRVSHPLRDLPRDLLTPRPLFPSC
jgi:hypothetical protein